MKKPEIKKLDKLWSESVKKKAGYKCEYCHRAGIQIGGPVWLNACHIIGRRYRSTRWVLKNGVCLCFEHHKQYDEHGPQHEDIRKMIGEERINFLLSIKEEVKKQSFEDVLGNLKLRGSL